MRILLWKKTKKQNKGETKKLSKKVIGQGTLYFSETLQKWVGQYLDPSGNRKTLTQKKLEKVGDFKTRFNTTLSSLDNGTYISESNTSLYDVLNNYIENKYKTGITCSRTYKRNTETLKLLTICCENFINKPIQKVNILDIKKALPNLIQQEVLNFKTKERYVKIYSQNVIDKEFALLYLSSEN